MQIGLASTFSSGIPSCCVACSNLTQSLGLMTGMTRSTSWAPAASSGTVRSGVSAAIRHHLGRDAGSLEGGCLSGSALIHAGAFRIDERRRLDVQRVAGERRIRGEDVLGASEEDSGGGLDRVSGTDRHAGDDRLGSGDRGVERLGSDERRTSLDRDDRAVVGELLTALLAFFFGVGDVTRHQFERMAADATGVLVDEVDGGLDAGDVRVGDLDSAALLVEVPDLDR